MSEVLILGGGLSGSTAAALLARAGRDVHVIERSSRPHHTMCGEFLSVEAVRHLTDIGIDPRSLGGTPIERVRLICGKKVIEAALPFPALGLSRLRLDEAVLERAQAAGARIERGVRVISLNRHVARTSAGERAGSHVMLATGKLPVRVENEPDWPAERDPYVGFKMHFRLPPAATTRLAGSIQLSLFPGGYAGLQTIEDGKSNLCLVIRRSRLARLGGNWGGVLGMLEQLPCLGDMLRNAEPLLERPVTIANLVYGRSRLADTQGGIMRLGDQAGMTASLTGDGMAIALRSAFLAAQCVIEQREPETYWRLYRRETSRQFRRAMFLQKTIERPLLRDVGIAALLLRPRLLGTLAAATRLYSTSP